MGENYQFHDFGCAAFGTLKVKLSGAPGTVVTLEMGEVASGGRINQAPGGFRCYKSCQVTLDDRADNWYKFVIPPHTVPHYVKFTIPSPLDEEIACFRYAGVAGDCEVLEFSRREVYPRWDERDAEFHCSDEQLNRIWEFCKYSTKATAAFGIFIDGERERCPYEGDAYINQLGWFCCSADPEIPRRTIDFFMDHSTWPIEWHLVMPLIVRDYLYYTGDTASVSRWLPMLKERLLDKLVRADGLLAATEELKELIDWPPWERDGYESSGCSLVPNCYRYGALLAMAELTGEESYAVKAAQLKQVIRKEMLKSHGFTDSPESSHQAQHSQFYPLFFHVAAPHEVDLSGCEMKCSVYGAQFLLDTLWSSGDAVQAVKLLKSDGLRSWQNMLNCGATITMEAWDDSLKENQDWNHAWGAAPANLIPRRLCGIRPTAPGFKTFTVDPQPAGIREFHLTVPTLHGKITVDHVDGEITVNFPAGLTAEFRGRQYTEKFTGKI